MILLSFVGHAGATGPSGLRVGENVRLDLDRLRHGWQRAESLVVIVSVRFRSVRVPSLARSLARSRCGRGARVRARSGQAPWCQ